MEPVHHSTTSSARPRRDGGIVRPRALAVLRLMTNSNLVGCSTGRSAGLRPFRILSTNNAARRQTATVSGPYDMRPPVSTLPERVYRGQPVPRRELCKLRSVKHKVDVIAAGPTPPAVAAKEATATIPIVLVT